MRELKIPTILWFLLCLVAAGVAQTAPELRHRGESGQSAETRAAKGFSTIPEQASGEYALDENGSVVQITIEHNRLSGYVTKMDGGTALTLFFDHTTINGNRLTFDTKPVHGMKFSFAGSIVRGGAETAAESGFYRLAGDWTTYRGGVGNTVHLSLKSTPREE
jgi:hypothetical protein